MIISHKHKFIFIKTRKTAGTSLEIALSKFCGHTDIITPLCLEDESIRTSLGARGPQNWYISPRTALRSRADMWALITKRRAFIKFYNHISALKIREQIDSHIWNTYFKFSIERNPWDQVVSRYFWRRESEDQTLINFLSHTILPEKLCNFDLYSIDGKIAVDKVYLYENLETALEDIASKLCLDKSISLPKAKSTHRPLKSRSYQDFFGEDEMKFVLKHFSREIDTFGYTF